MEEQVKSLTSAIEACGNIRAEQITSHPDIETLADYHDGLLPEDEDAKIQSHVSICKTCAQILLNFESAVQLRPDISSNRSGFLTETQKEKSSNYWQSYIFSKRNFLIAATLVTGFFLLYFILNKPLFSNNEFYSPTSENIALLELLPSNFKERSDSTLSTHDITDISYNTIFLLNPAGQTPQDKYFARIFSEGSSLKNVWKGFLKSTKDNIILLLIPKSFLKEGNYRIVVYKSENAKEPILEYKFSISDLH